VADADLIDEYGSRLGRLLRWRPDADDVVAETIDHLRSAVEHLMHDGADPVQAQRLTLERFGDVAVVARSFAVTAAGGLRVPTRFTRACGYAALAAAVAWLAASVAAIFGHSELLGWSAAGYYTWSAVTGLAAAGSLAALAGSLRRAGAGRGMWSRGAVALAGVGVAALAALPWLWPLGGGLWAAASVVAAGYLRAARLPVPWPAWLAPAAFPAGFACFAALACLHAGPIDSYGDYQVASLAGFAAGALLLALSLAALGSWLRREAPADLPEPAAAA
jgi:hypothetical protein